MSESSNHHLDWDGDFVLPLRRRAATATTRTS